MGAAREAWRSRVGLILAMAGNAVGLGNFLRFPRQAALNGGGAFMVPYFVALLLLGIPLMWVEWSIGRLGGRHGHGSTPGMFAVLLRHPVAKYLGALGVAIPLCFVMYYTYVEAWTLAFSVFSAMRHYWGIDTFAGMAGYLAEFQGRAVAGGPGRFAGVGVALGFYLVTLGINVWVLSRGVVQGIERLAKVALPSLFLFAAVLAVRVALLPADAASPDHSVAAGFAYVWNPDLSRLAEPAVWLAAAGQIFFTLSIGTGSIHTYASYVDPESDIVLTGLTTSATNELAEVVLGGSIAIPAAVAFFGLAAAQSIAASGSFDLGFAAMPVIFEHMGPLGPLWGCLWFLLLFFAGITSSVALAQPAMAFLQDEMALTRRRAAAVVGALMAVGGLACVAFLGHGFLDEMDFWAGTFGLVVFALIEVVLFIHVFGRDRSWEEITRGAEIRLPRLLRPVLAWVTPSFLAVLLVAWAVRDALPVLRLEGRSAGDVPYLWGARGLMVATLLLFLLLVRVAWRRRPARGVAP